MMKSSSEIKTIIVCEEEIVQSQTGSKGNQIKYYKDGMWIKQDLLGYEGLAEVVCSQLAEAFKFPCVKYYPCKIYIFDTGETKSGCYSYSFIPEGYMEISLQGLVQRCTGFTCEQLLEHFSSVEDKIKGLADALHAVIEPSTLVKYLCQLLFLDFITFNEDRHWANICFLYDSNKVYPAPIFDNGASFFSDTKLDYPFDLEIEYCIQKARAKPFSRSFAEQKEAACNLAPNLFIKSRSIAIDYSDLIKYYDREAIDRVKAVLRTTL